MIDLPTIEQERVAEQSRIDSHQTSEERNRMGQFATPFPLAQELAVYAKTLLDPLQKPIRFLEPSVGTGAFFSALRTVFSPEDIGETVGVEINSTIIEAARRLWKSDHVQLIHADFTALEPNPAHTFNLILANPPYIRHHYLSPSQKGFLRDRVHQETAYHMNGLAGLYCYFMLLAHRWLADDGLAIWLIPSEFMGVNYGSILRRYLVEDVTLLHIHRARPSELQFDDALVSTAIVVYRKSKPDFDHYARFSFGGSLIHPEHERLLSVSELRDHPKWTKFTADAVQTPRNLVEVPRLGDLFDVKRGIATGANAYFILTRAEAESLGLPEQYLRPILPSPRYLKGNIIEADRDGFPKNLQQSVLLDCSLSREIVKDRFPKLDTYLSSGETQGIHNRYLTKNRSPWYRQEYRPIAPFMCTYMGRSLASRDAIRFFWNQSQAVGTNVYLLLYPKPQLASALHFDPNLHVKILDELLKIDPQELNDEGRVYGGALHKIEPKELGRVPLSGIIKWVQLGEQLPLF